MTVVATSTTTSLPQAPGSQARDAARKVPTRRISFEESLAAVPQHFAEDGDLVTSHLIAALSALFPDGEDFFVRSVRAYRDQITDPALKRQVAGFIGQESVHGREHRALNDRFAELGYPTKRIARMAKRGLGFRERIFPPISNLAATAALEHFTATLAELLLSSAEIRELMGDDAVRNVFLWHALEESEHKAVAFDVYRAVGGGEKLRVWTMNAMTYIFLSALTTQITISVLGDRATYRRGNLVRSLKRLKGSPLLDKAIWHQLREYNQPDFHPDDRDTTALIDEWREKLFGEHGTLNELLAGSHP